MYIKKEHLPNFFYYKYRFKSRARQMLMGARKNRGAGLMNTLKHDLLSQVYTHSYIMLLSHLTGENESIINISLLARVENNGNITISFVVNKLLDFLNTANS